MKVLTGILAILISASSVWAAMEMTPYQGSAELQRLKTFEGKWEGTGKEIDGTENPVKVEYAVTSNGSAVIEKLFAGSPHEMVTVYYDKKGKLALTHYCSVGNRPEMDLVAANDNKIELSLNENSPIGVNEGHMHALVISFEGKDHIEQSWTLYQDGKEAGKAVFNFRRAK